MALLMYLNIWLSESFLDEVQRKLLKGFVKIPYVRNGKQSYRIYNKLISTSLSFSCKLTFP